MTGDQPRAREDELLLHLLVLRCQAGDERALARLLDRYGARTLRYLRTLVGDDAEDVQQEVWLGVYRRIGQLERPGAFVTWLLRMTRHRAIDHLRRRRRERELLDDLALDVLATDDPGDDDAFDALDEVAVAAAVAALPAAQREVFLLRYQDGMSYVDMALVVGCSVGTIRSRLHHARRRLQALLQPTPPAARPSHSIPV
jgi:RNA polymerase sigma-70 factor (ECF subfamily)